MYVFISLRLCWVFVAVLAFLQLRRAVATLQLWGTASHCVARGSVVAACRL